MQRVDCTVRLGGRVDFTVEKTDIPVPEVAVLRYIHGQDAVVNVRVLKGPERKPRHSVIRERLDKEYRDPDGNSVCSILWPGLATPLPTKLTDIGLKADGAIAFGAGDDDGAEDDGDVDSLGLDEEAA